MQAQAAGGSGEGIQGLLQNPKVQIGVIAVGAIAIIVVIYLLFFASNAAPAPTPTTAGAVPVVPEGSPGAPGAPGAPTSAVPPTDMAPTAPSAPGTSAVPGAPSVAGAPAGVSGPGGAAGAAAEGAKAKGPGVPVRKNPFAETKEIKGVLDSIPTLKAPEFTAQAHSLYVDELHKPRPKVDLADRDDSADEPPIPTMRVAGVVYGKQVSATLQIGEQYMQVTPGQMVPASNPIYRVDRIEQEKVYLSRRWETGSGDNSKKGVQRIEVGLTARAATAGSGAYGAPGGYPGGYPGSSPVPSF